MRPDARRENSRVRQILAGFGVIALVAAVIILCGFGRLIPGFIGEWFAMVSGIATTPGLMEASLFVLGLLAVLVVNHWRHVREGDECVYLEQTEGPEAETLPDQARWAVYRETPLEGEVPDLLTEAEGAVAIGDPQAALEAIGRMTDTQRLTAPVLRLRVRIARDTGHDELAARLEERLARTQEP